jgi:hypothetical protein
MTDEEQALYEEQEKVRQALRPFIQPHYADSPATFTLEQLEHADKLRERDKQIEARLEELQKRKTT